jgi:hypothetical protein
MTAASNKRQQIAAGRNDNIQHGQDQLIKELPSSGTSGNDSVLTRTLAFLAYSLPGIFLPIH